ncbi:hypothetical protein C7S16_3279 [Burkholderia thailandensis]|uniref:Lipoprotein n=1 Tax=Burkholderia thailandensis TaxID=57975 RepID=A0AAW9CXU5_BURTH|nr:hypothetical protein [Burkholderia thailandensis]MDW9255322.1 hypothetical protein [Burkholderia thailandensis]
MHAAVRHAAAVFRRFDSFGRDRMKRYAWAASMTAVLLLAACTRTDDAVSGKTNDAPASGASE